MSPQDFFYWLQRRRARAGVGLRLRLLAPRADLPSAADAAATTTHVKALGAVMSAATWDTAEAARSLGCSPANVRYLIDRGELPAVVTGGGRYMLDRRAVEAHAPASTRTGKTERVPALYLRAGTRGAANLVAVVVGRDGAALEGELVRSVDGVDELVFEDWREAVIVGGKGQDGHDRARALHVRPAHGRPASSFGLDGLEARGRWEILDKTNNRAEAVDMLGRIRAWSDRVKAGRKNLSGSVEFDDGTEVALETYVFGKGRAS